MPSTYRHPVNQQFAAESSRGARIADRVTGYMGSWAFIVVQTIIVLLWIGVNVFHLLNATFDPYPFILLNLAFSTQAAYAAPLILLASNRAAARDRLTLEHAASISDVEERQNEELLKGNTQILLHVERLEERILQLETRIVGLLEGGARP